ncbi:spore coat U domain-containing protein [Thermosynechococcaceae cyanobacterium Okahandja]
MSATRLILLGLPLLSLLWVKSAASQGTGCQFQGVTGLNFGVYDPFAPVALDSTGQLRFVCSGGGAGSFNNRPVTIQLSQGNSNSFTPRQMSSGSNRLDYNLYLDSDRSVIWGDGTSGSRQRGPFIPGNNVVNTLTIYGRIPPQQWVAPGTYSDSLRVTIQF